MLFTDVRIICTLERTMCLPLSMTNDIDQSLVRLHINKGGHFPTSSHRSSRSDIEGWEYTTSSLMTRWTLLQWMWVYADGGTGEWVLSKLFVRAWASHRRYIIEFIEDRQCLNEETVFAIIERQCLKQLLKLRHFQSSLLQSHCAHCHKPVCIQGVCIEQELTNVSHYLQRCLVWRPCWQCLLFWVLVPLVWLNYPCPLHYPTLQ